MYAGHFAAGLAIKGVEPRAPTWALMGAAFLPDIFWLGFSIAGVERVDPAPAWFDGWSHSLLSITLQAMILVFLTAKLGRPVALAIGAAVLSHLALDLPMHPAPLEMYPHAAARVGDFLHGWSSQQASLGKSKGWWTEAGVTIPLLAIYILASHRTRIKRPTAAASTILVCSLQIAFG